MTIPDRDLIRATAHLHYLGDAPSYRGHGGQAAYGLLLDICRRYDADLADRIHGGGDLKPIAVSPLQQAKSNTTVCLSVAALTPFIAEGVRNALQHAANYESELHLAGSPIRIDDLQLTAATYERLLSAATPARKVKLHFGSPTLFRRSGQSLVLPEPELLFRSLLQTWNAFSPLQFPPHDPAEFSTIMVSRHRIHTEIVDFGAYKLVGFVGRVSYLFPKRFPDLLRTTLNCLAAYASFSGVGYRTTMGMGQCRKAE